MGIWLRGAVLGVLPVLSAAALQQPGFDGASFHICSVSDTARTPALLASLPPATCDAPPSGFVSLPSIGGRGDTSTDLRIGYDSTTQRLCYVSTHSTLPPVLRVGTGHTLQIALANTLRNTADAARINCPIQGYADGTACAPEPHYRASPGADGSYYPIEANQAHAADGTTNLHVHGMFVTPAACSDDVLYTTVFPANWRSPVPPLHPCQPTADTITYRYAIPDTHPPGLYWFHAHRHGESEPETQMGLAGAIVVEDAGDAWRDSIGVTDEVLLINDQPLKNCNATADCGSARQLAARAARPRRAAARALATAAATAPGLDPRIDEADQAGSCAPGATGDAGGAETWKLTLNGAPVVEYGFGQFPPDFLVLSKVMQPGQRQIFRLVNASANSFVAPQLLLVQDGTKTFLPMEILGRDGVPIADANGVRGLQTVDSGTSPIIVPPAGRLEFVLHAPPLGAKVYLDSAQVFPGCAGNLYPPRRLMKITSKGTAVDPGAPDDSDLVEHNPSIASYLHSLQKPATVHRTIVFTEYGRDFTYAHTTWLTGPPGDSDFDDTATDFFITEIASDDGETVPSATAIVPFLPQNGQPTVTVHLHGQESVTEDWLVENATLEIHDFHIHQVHFEDVTTPLPAGQVPPILDSIVVPAAQLVGDTATGTPGAPGWVRLRMTFTRQDLGEFVFHCHILEHEDNGMMAKIRVVAD